MILENRRVRLRPIECRDLETLRQWANTEEVSRGLNRVRPISEIAHQQWFQKLEQDPTQIGFSAEVRDGTRLIGAVFLREIEHCCRRARILIFIGSPEERGYGYGTEVMELLLRYGFGQLNLHRIDLLVASDNEAAVRLYQKMGFVTEGTLRDYFYFSGHYRDALCMSILSDEFPKKVPSTTL